MKKAFFLLLLLVLSVSYPALANADTPVSQTPSLFFCVGKNPQPPCATEAPSAPVSQAITQPATSNTPSGTPTGTSTNQPSQSITNPSPTSGSSNPPKTPKHKTHPPTQRGGIQQFIQFLIQLIQLILQLLGGQLPTINPGGNGNTPSSTPSGGNNGGGNGNNPSSGTPSGSNNGGGNGNNPSSGTPSGGNNGGGNGNNPSSGTPSGSNNGGGNGNNPSSGTPSGSNNGGGNGNNPTSGAGNNPTSGASACSGSATVTVPNVIYDTISAAESALTKVGLKPNLNNNSGKNTGVIYSQTPAANTTNVKCGSTVDIASVPATVTVPNVINDSVTAAENALRGQGLKYTLNNKKGSGPIDSQTPKSGTKVNSGSNVDIEASANTASSNACTVAGGKCITSAQATTDSKTMTVTHLAEDPACAAITAGTECWKETAKATTTTNVTVPKVVGETVSVAESGLTNAGLKYTLNSSKGTGPIDSQTPAAGTSVAKGSNVDIDASATSTTTSKTCTAAGYSCFNSANAATAVPASQGIVTHSTGASQYDTSCGSGKACYEVKTCASAGFECLTSAQITTLQKTMTITHSTAAAAYDKNCVALNSANTGCYEEANKSSAVDSSSHTVSSSSTGSASVFSDAVNQTEAFIQSIWLALTSPIW